MEGRQQDVGAGAFRCIRPEHLLDGVNYLKAGRYAGDSRIGDFLHG